MPKTKTPAASPNVKVGIPHMPSMYTSQHKKKFFPWTHAEQRLIKSRSYFGVSRLVGKLAATADLLEA